MQIFFAPAIENTEELIVPTVSVYEVFKRVLQQRNEGDALQAVATLAQGQIVELNTALALDTARISVVHKIPMADSMMLATARAYHATLWTQDADLKDIGGVEYIEKR
jgi:predicted nucleic acid-binding protein